MPLRVPNVQSMSGRGKQQPGASGSSFKEGWVRIGAREGVCAHADARTAPGWPRPCQDKQEKKQIVILTRMLQSWSAAEEEPSWSLSGLLAVCQDGCSVVPSKPPLEWGYLQDSLSGMGVKGKYT